MNQEPTASIVTDPQQQGRAISSASQQETTAYISDMLQQLEGLASQAQLTELAFMIRLAKNCSRQFE
jgi:hypothetical protein